MPILYGIYVISATHDYIEEVALLLIFKKAGMNCPPQGGFDFDTILPPLTTPDPIKPYMMGNRV